MSHHIDTEGVIKYRLEFEKKPHQQSQLALQLEPWRQRLCELGMIGGNDATRYDGLGFGNLSHRVTPALPAFIISGTQTGHLQQMGSECYALVSECDPINNVIHAHGEIAPSSEAMTHAAIYAAATTAQAVIHVHSPDLWLQAEALGLTMTDPTIAYGTSAMAQEFARLISCNAVSTNVIAMGGHEDGIISWGDSLDEAADLLLSIAHRLNDAEQGG